MKKKFFIVLIIAILVILLFLGILILKNNNAETIAFYQTSFNFNEIENSPSITVGNLSMQVTNFFLNGQYPTELDNLSDNEKLESNCVQRLKIWCNNNIQSVLYDYIIYDNNGNILSTNLCEFIPNEKEQNDFIKYFNKTVFNSTNISDYKDRILCSNSIAETIVSTENPVSNTISSRIIGFREGSYEDNFEQVHILIINPEYQEYGNSEYIKLENTVFEFIINNL